MTGSFLANRKRLPECHIKTQRYAVEQGCLTPIDDDAMVIATQRYIA
jgi:hypothetical protein